MRCTYYNSYYIYALIKQRNKTNGSTQSCIFDPSSKHQTLDVPFIRRHMHTSDTDTHVHMRNRTTTYMNNQNQNSSKHINFLCRRKHNNKHNNMLLYVNLCRNMLRLNVIYSLWYSKMCSTAALLRENLYQEESFTDSKQVYTKCEYFQGTIPCRNEIQGLILEVVMMHLELCESILRLRNFWYYNLYRFA